MPNSRGTGVFFLRHKFSPVRHAVIADCLKLGVHVGFGATYSGINFVKEFAQIGVVFEEFTYADTQRQNKPQLFFPYLLVFETRHSVENDCKDFCPSVHGNFLSG
jgi:hypothetical protein